MMTDKRIATDHSIVGNNVDLSRYVEVEPPGFHVAHPIYGYLRTKDRIESIKIFNHRQPKIDDTTNPICICIVNLGRHVEGHKGIVHGGVLALLIDEVIGLGCEALGGLQGLSFTANLSIDYRNPCPTSTKLRISVFLMEHNGRKLIWKCCVESSNQQTLYCEAKSLFLLPKHMDAKSAISNNENEILNSTYERRRISSKL